MNRPAGHFASEELPTWLIGLLAITGTVITTGAFVIALGNTGGLQATLRHPAYAATAPANPAPGDVPSAGQWPSSSGQAQEAPALETVAPPQVPSPEPAKASAVTVAGATSAFHPPPLPSVDVEDCAPLFTLSYPINQSAPEPLSGDPQALELKRWLGANPDAILVLEGHTDALGDVETNLVLCLRRAMGLKEQLAAIGIPSQRLEVEAFGSLRPLDGAHPEDGANRRTSMRIDGWRPCLPSNAN
jgi:outer membrane protein OmpA-like peptidoglycan-associated protein